MRKQTNKVSTGKTTKIIAILIAIIFVVLLAFMLANYIYSNKNNNTIVFDKNAIVGEPSPDKEYYYSSLTSPTGYYVSLASNLYRQDDDSLMLFLTNPSINDVYFMCKIENTKGEVLYQSNVIKPGEYIDKLKAYKKIEEDKEIDIKIYIIAYEKDTYYSAGEVVLNGVLY